MRVAQNDDELARLIMQDMQSAVQETKNKAMTALGKGILYFYSGGTPVVYQRTYQLMRTPRTTDVRMLSGRHLEFEAYLDDGGGYTTGKHPSMAQVLDLTDKGSSPGLRPAVGNKGYWDMICTQIDSDFVAAMKQYFD